MNKKEYWEEKDKLFKPAEQPQVEPVAWRFVEPGDEYNGYQQKVRVTVEKPSPTRARLGCEPLFAHADPGEVERLRKENDALRLQAGGMQMEIDKNEVSSQV